MHSIPEFGHRNNIGPTSVYAELNSGRLEGVKFGSKTLITEEAEEAWRKRLPKYQPAQSTEKASA
jgi:hypothetical protein